MDIQSSLFEKRFPYANEAKAIVAEQLEKNFGLEIAQYFSEVWTVKRVYPGKYSIIRDFSIKAGAPTDFDVHDALQKEYNITLVNERQ